jgi:hypothetical protein
MDRQAQRGHCREHRLDHDAADPQALDSFGQMRLGDGVEIAIGQAVEQVAKGEQEEEDQQAFPERAPAKA